MKTKIVVAGIGGVGGYFGGMLSRKYENDLDVEVYFFARGAHLEKIQKEGLLVKTMQETFLTKPRLATDDATQIGEANYVLIASKSYDLESIIEKLKPCIGSKTILVPLLNGINITELIRKILPVNEVLYGCVYIIARLIEPGIIQVFGGPLELFFGVDQTPSDKVSILGSILHEAQIKGGFLPDILSKLWEKFLLISTFGTATSYFDCSFGALFVDAGRYEALCSLMKECMEIAYAEKIPLRKELPEETIALMKTTPFDSTSSIHSDYQSKRKTELATITEIVLVLAEKHGIAAPIYSQMYATLSKR